MQRAIIEFVSPAGRKRKMLLTGQEPVTIGRDSGNSLAFDDDLVSREHCVIEKIDSTFTVRDLGSRNGIKVNGKQVVQAELQSGDWLQVGQVKIRFVLEQMSPKARRPEMPARSASSGVVATASSEAGVPPSVATPAPPRPDEPKPSHPWTDSTGCGAAPHLGEASVRVDPALPVGEANRDKLAQIAIDQHEELSKWIDSLLDKSFDVSAVALINARRQTVYAAEDDDLESTITAGRESVLFLRSLLLLCLRFRATDLHIEPKGDPFQVRVRVDGMMVSVIQLHKLIGQRLLRVVKVLSDIDIAQISAVQEGHFSTALPGRRVDYRVSFTPTMHGQKLVIRVLDLANAPQFLKQLTLSAWMNKDLKQVIQQDTGMILLCGPTGSGKTTTLYALVREINVSQRNVITIEDPVEYQIEDVTQLPINEVQGNSFSSLLRSVLRQDPDVILVGEVRDPETATIAMQAAITGHLVFSTVHARDAIGTIFRLLNLGVEPYLVATALNLVLAQRLVRQLCPHCKMARRVSPGQMTRLGRYGVQLPRTIYEPAGCDQCLRTGYLGRRAIFELLNVTDELRDVILAAPQIQDMRKAIRATLFTSLHETGFNMVAAGITSISEIERVVGAE